jgi:hypothetical protein
MTDTQLSSSARRLAEELEDHGVSLREPDGVRDVLLEELDYARRVPMFEGRQPVYGSFSMPPGTEIRDAEGVTDLVALDGMPRAMARTFADGRSGVRRELPRPTIRVGLLRSAGAVRGRAGGAAAALPRPHRAALTDHRPGAAVHRPTRRVVERAELDRPAHRRRAQPSLLASAPEIDPTVARGLLDLTMHWLSPARVGATIVVHETNFEWSSMDVSSKFKAPRLSLRNRQHYPALFASLQQHDLATLVTADGSVEYLGVGLRSSEEAERNTDLEQRGMRHRSAQRFSYDHPSTTIAVVSDNGPVTIFRGGREIALTPTDT